MAILLSLLLILLVAEVVLRAIDYRPASTNSLRKLRRTDDPHLLYDCFPENRNGEFDPLPDTEEGPWELLTNTGEPLPWSRLQETPWCVEYRLSKLKLREKELPGYWPPEGKTRIACVGDSFVYGQGVPVERTLPHLLELELDTDYQVVNVSYIAWDLSEEMKQLAHFRKQKHCSRALFVFIVNDLFLSRELKDRHTAILKMLTEREAAVADYERGWWKWGPSRVMQAIHATILDAAIGKETIAWYRDCFDPEVNAVGLELFEQQLKQLAHLKDCQVAMVIYPLMKGLEGEYPLTEAHALIAKMATEAGIPVLDLLPAFVGQKTSDLWVDPADQHPNGKAHAIAAKAIAEWLRDDQAEFLEEETR